MTTAHRWEKHYPPHLHGYQVSVKSLLGSLAAFARESAERFAGAPAFTQVLPNGLHVDLSFADIDRLSSAFAAYLLHERGCKSARWWLYSCRTVCTTPSQFWGLEGRSDRHQCQSDVHRA